MCQLLEFGLLTSPTSKRRYFEDYLISALFSTYCHLKITSTLISICFPVLGLLVGADSQTQIGQLAGEAHQQAVSAFRPSALRSSTASNT
ncbi:unnamed protein product [Nesidiocoris tenuis]|uniref:Uncharacterized protein n=1 Tax=Nesidiocoris tenuis TaxID=355587 RepID=A0A6H5H723_9HEMI|nr:unnamed protein product [Nesidiocoris tenuis]